jgi:hypothetical protein
MNFEVVSPSQPVMPDINLYPVKLCDLLGNWKAYDRKLVKIQATFRSYDDLPAIFSDPTGFASKIGLVPVSRFFPG